MSEPAISHRPIMRSGLLDFLQEHNRGIVFGFNCVGSLLFAWAGRQNHNPYYVYSAFASIVATGSLTIPELLRSQFGEERVKQWRENVTTYARPLHNSAGIATILSGFYHLHGKLDKADLEMGALTTAGSLTQFWAPYITKHSGKIASVFYAWMLPGAYGKVLELHRAHEPFAVMLGAAACYTVSIGNLLLRPREAPAQPALQP